MTETFLYALILCLCWFGISLLVGVIVGKAIKLGSGDEDK